MQTSPQSSAHSPPAKTSPPEEPAVHEVGTRIFVPYGVGFPDRHRRLIFGGEYKGLKGTAQESITHASNHLADTYGAVVVLLGPRGHGKTTIATLMAHNYQAPTAKWCLWKMNRERETVEARYWTLGDLFGEAKAEWERRHEPDATSVMDTARRCRILVLDELQEALGSDWERNEFVRLVDTRYREGRATILLANATPSGFQIAVGDSVVSRLQEVGLIVVCDWESRR